MTPGWGRCPVHHSNCRSACAMSIGSPSSVRHPASRASRSRGVSRSPYVRSHTSVPLNGPRGRGVSARAFGPPSGVQLTSRSQEPAAGGHDPTSAWPDAATSRACSRRRACTVTRAPRATSATATARAAPPAPITAARTPRSGRGYIASSGSRNPCTSVLVASQGGRESLREPKYLASPGCDFHSRNDSRPLRNVFTAPTARARSSAYCAASSASTLNGIVTLAPLKSSASANVRKS